MAYYPSQITRVICQQLLPEAYELQRRYDFLRETIADFGADSHAARNALLNYQETRQSVIDFLQVSLDNLKAEINENPLDVVMEK